MKVYVITDGSYSDYRICAVSLDKNKAKKIKETIHADNDIEEYDTDQFDCIANGYNFYDITLNELNNPKKIHKKTSLEISPWDALDGTVVYSGHLDNFRVCNILAKDRDVAIKIARDKRAEYLAKMKGVKL